MQWWEVNRFLNGMYRRQRTAWLVNRHLEWILVRMFSDSKKSTPPNSPEDLYKFGWEEVKSDTPALTPEEIAEMHQMMRDFNW